MGHYSTCRRSRRFGNVAVTAKPITLDDPRYVLCQVQDVTTRSRAAEAQKQLQAAIIDMQAAALVEMATPLIPISGHVVVMPLIGVLAVQQAQQVLETLLHGVTTTRARVVIVDIIGLRTVDAQGANTLVQAMRAGGNRHRAQQGTNAGSARAGGSRDVHYATTRCQLLVSELNHVSAVITRRTQDDRQKIRRHQGNNPSPAYAHLHGEEVR